VKRKSVKFPVLDMVAKFHGQQDAAVKAGRVAASDLIRLGASFTRPDGTLVALPWGAPIPDGYQRTTGVVSSDDWLGFLADGISTIDGSEPAILNKTRMARMFDHSIRHTAAFGGDLAFGKAIKEAATQYRVAPAADRSALAQNLDHLVESLELVSAARLKKVLKNGGMPLPDPNRISDPAKIKKFFAGLSHKKLRQAHEFLDRELKGAMVFYGAVSADPYIRFMVLEGRLSRATIDVTGGSRVATVVPYGSMMRLSRKTRDLHETSHQLSRFMNNNPIYESLRQEYHEKLADGLTQTYLLAELLSRQTSDWWVRAYTQFDGAEFKELLEFKCAGWPMPHHPQIETAACP
jgi:hypothetical protein